MIGNVALIVAGLILAVGGAVLSAMSMRVLVKLLIAGPAAAEEAFASGASLSNWWSGTHPVSTATSSSFSAKSDPIFGDVMVESASREPAWLK